MRFTRIAGTGHHVPPRVVTNHDLEQLMDTSDEWIRERTGIRERRFVEPGTGSSVLGAEAARAALKDAGWKPTDVQFIVFATVSPDLYFPGCGVLLQAALGIPEIGALDVRNQCTGFVYGLAVVDAFIRMGMYDRVLLVGSEVHSAGLQMNTAGRDTAVLFGDGAGAVCLEVTTGEDGSRLLWHHLHADGRFARELSILSPGSANSPWITKEMVDDGSAFPHMNGREVFKHAVTRFPEVIESVLASQKLSRDDLDLVIPHQANERITEAVRKRLGVDESKVYSNIAKYGNTTAASIPIALSEAVSDGKVKRGNLVCLAAFGSGFTWGASLLRY
ncbi:MAG: ketoacyl-ACP synthase III [Gemmatimonadota bacterium]|nr:ketoacyl-ACP synthase III [Gemmatimonadota bacterium]MDH3477479.1 ketoacyl-ACP synthase III [Gemmatimonadota bacterium]MDH3571149.1 ketoacyl-ACP synthase III [Gemmatimonadota bacterium]MDH5548697.1 ketoacyl-ACP synthase III [Gemmatimonadota bacterium]